MNQQRHKGKEHKIKQQSTRGSGEHHQANEDKTRTKQGGVTRGNKEVGQEEHMANTNRDRAMC